MAAIPQNRFRWTERRGWRYALAIVALVAWQVEPVHAERPISVFDDNAFEQPFAGAELTACENCDPADAAFDTWDQVVDPDDRYVMEGQHFAIESPNELKPFDWVRHMGFRHSSTHGRHVGRGLPLEGSSWMNRPYHIDWFSGPLLGDDLVDNQVAQDNELFGGLRVGIDIDYYWGLEARFGWANPNVQFTEPQPVADNGSYFVSDVDLVYYPWGDSKVRPYMLLGAGLARIDFVDSANVNFNTTLFTMPFGGGIQFRQTPSLIWRFEVLDNLSYGADGVDTMHNVSLTAGMEIRLGARPKSYWPWRSGRHFW